MANLGVLLSVYKDVHIFGHVFSVNLKHLHGFDGLNRLLIENDIFEVVESFKGFLNVLVVAVSIQPATEKLLSNTVLAEDDFLSLLYIPGLILLCFLELLVAPLLLDL